MKLFDFNKNKEKNKEQYLKCLEVKEKLRDIEGVIRFHQEFLQENNVLPVDYWVYLIKFYRSQVKNDENDIGAQMLLKELVENEAKYNEYFKNELLLASLKRKLSDLDRQEIMEKAKRGR